MEAARSISRRSTVSWARHVIRRAFRSTNCDVTLRPGTVCEVTVPIPLREASADSNDDAGMRRRSEPDRSWDDEDWT
jgi:hypothetical protein